jgi:hypothetical protein
LDETCHISNEECGLYCIPGGIDMMKFALNFSVTAAVFVAFCFIVGWLSRCLVITQFIVCCQTQAQSKRGTRRKTISEDTVPPAATTPSVVTAASGVPPVVTGVQDQTGQVHVIETEKNTFSTEVSRWIAARKRPPGTTTATSRHRSVESTELDLSTINDQLCNHRFVIKEVTPDAKVCAMHF